MGLGAAPGLFLFYLEAVLEAMPAVTLPPDHPRTPLASPGQGFVRWLGCAGLACAVETGDQLPHMRNGLLVLASKPTGRLPAPPDPLKRDISLWVGVGGQKLKLFEHL